GSTGALGAFRFSSQGGVAAGVRRIEAVTGPVAYQAVDALDSRIQEAAQLLKAQPDHLARKIEQLLAERERLAARLAEAMQRGAAPGEVERTVVEVNGVTLALGDAPSEDRDEIGRVADRFRTGKRS